MTDMPYRPVAVKGSPGQYRVQPNRSLHGRASSPGFTLLLTSTGIVRQQQSTAGDTTDVELYDMVDENPLAYIHPSDRERVSKQFDRLLADDAGAVFATEFRLRDTTDTYHWFEAKGSSCPTSGPLSDTLVIARHIQQRSQTDDRRRSTNVAIEQLQQTTQHLLTTSDAEEAAQIAMAGIEKVFNFSIAGIWLANDAQTRLEPITMSERGKSLIDTQPVYSADSESLSWTAFRSQTPKKIDDMWDHPERVNDETPIRSEIIVPVGELGMLNIGSTETAAFSNDDFKNVQVWGNTVESALVRVAQIDRLQKRETALKRERDRLEDFTDIISHDLRNLVNVAHGHLGMARSQKDLSRLDTVVNAIERMDDIIDDTLTLAKQGDTVDEMERVDIEVMATNCLSVTDTATATFECPDNFSILADSDRLAHVFENLFRNAVDHGGTDVTVTLGRTNDGFYVADDGPGIPPADRESVFESGYSTATDGSGLGLRIVQQMVEAHGWSITVTESNAGGARFEVSGVTFVET